MTTTYKLCETLIARGKTDGLLDKLDAFLAADRITPEEYRMLAEQCPEPAKEGIAE